MSYAVVAARLHLRPAAVVVGLRPNQLDGKDAGLVGVVEIESPLRKVCAAERFRIGFSTVRAIRL